ncbi:MAG: aspartate/glutamate racemase family protein [Bradyrhizobiaceae bacterium]|nr:aspartate/glutamate racemase family protein [Bradyrhizobiaceae bacterium]
MTKKRILVILPVNNQTNGEGILEELASAIAPDFELELRRLADGEPFIDNRYEEAVNTRAILVLAKAAEKEGYDGIFINCFGEPGVEAARELVKIPVIGGFRPALLAAKLLAQTYSIITITKNSVPIVRSLANWLGVMPASIRDINMHILQLHDRKQLVERLVDQSTKAIVEDGAEAIVLGCTGISGLSDTIAEALAAAGKPAPVIDPGKAAVGFLQALIRAQISQSRLTYAKPMDMRELVFQLHHHHSTDSYLPS